MDTPAVFHPRRLRKVVASLVVPCKDPVAYVLGITGKMEMDQLSLVDTDASRSGLQVWRLKAFVRVLNEDDPAAPPALVQLDAVPGVVRVHPIESHQRTGAHVIGIAGRLSSAMCSIVSCVSTWVRVCIHHQALLPSPSLYSLATPCQNRSSSNASCERAPGCWSRCNHERYVSRGDVRSVSDCSASARSPRNRFPCQVESLSAKEVAAIRTANLNAPLPGGTWFDGHQYMDHTGIPTPVRSRCVACACRL